MPTTFVQYLNLTVSAVSAVEGMFEEGKALYTKTAELMANAEKAFAALPGAGATKKAIVMAGISVFVTTLSTSWDAVKDLVSAFIDSVVQTYNTVTAVAAPVPQS